MFSYSPLACRVFDSNLEESADVDKIRPLKRIELALDTNSFDLSELIGSNFFCKKKEENKITSNTKQSWRKYQYFYILNIKYSSNYQN